MTHSDAQRSLSRPILQAQLEMWPHPEQNLVELDRALAHGASIGCDLVVCPELSITGFHRGVKELCDRVAVERWMRDARARCVRHGVGAIVGIPWPCPSGGWLNTMWVIGPDGEVLHRQAKVGLTPSEATWFTAGEETTVGRIGRLRLAIVMCREILDVDRNAELAGRADLIVWPGHIKSDAASGDDYLQCARTTASTLGIPIVQCNWPVALNAPVTGMGASVVISATGRVVSRLPFDAPALAPVGPADIGSLG